MPCHACVSCCLRLPPRGLVQPVLAYLQGRGAHFTSTPRQGQHLPIPWALTLCSKISPVLRQDTEAPPQKEHLLVTWEMGCPDL